MRVIYALIKRSSTHDPRGNFFPGLSQAQIKSTSHQEQRTEPFLYEPNRSDAQEIKDLPSPPHSNQSTVRSPIRT